MHYFRMEAFGKYCEARERERESYATSLTAHLAKDVKDIVMEENQRRYIVRRLTPLECCRLQGFPDYWTEGVPGSDSAQYKMWGNGMALPCALFVEQGIKEVMEREKAEKA